MSSKECIVVERIQYYQQIYVLLSWFPGIKVFLSLRSFFPSKVVYSDKASPVTTCLRNNTKSHGFTL